MWVEVQNYSINHIKQLPPTKRFTVPYIKKGKQTRRGILQTDLIT